MKQPRLLHIIGSVKLFLSLDPDYKLCTRCKARKATVQGVKYTDGGSRSQTVNICKRCNNELKNK